MRFLIDVLILGGLNSGISLYINLKPFLAGWVGLGGFVFFIVELLSLRLNVMKKHLLWEEKLNSIQSFTDDGYCKKYYNHFIDSIV